MNRSCLPILILLAAFWLAVALLIVLAVRP